MYIDREYSDFVVASYHPPILSSALTRRHLFLGSSAVALTTIMNPPIVSALNLQQVADGVNATVSVLSNVDHLAGEVWPKVKHFFESGKSYVQPSTIGRIADKIDTLLDDPTYKAVSIADNRTPVTQQGYVRHFYDQDFNQAFVDWCTCNAQLNEKAAAHWESIAQAARQRGDFLRERQALAIAAQDRQNARMYLAKIKAPIIVGPVPAVIQSGKPLLTTVEATPELANELDEGDYCVTHAVAQRDKAAGLTRV
jgi:hypothetical protein